MKWLKKQITFLQISTIISIKGLEMLIAVGRERLCGITGKVCATQEQPRAPSGQRGRWGAAGERGPGGLEVLRRPDQEECRSTF